MELNKEYSRNVNQLRKERSLAVHRISEFTKELDSLLNALALDDGETLIKWEDLKKAKIGIQLYISEKVYFVKYMERLDVLGFKCFLEAGGSFGLQKHDCLEETLILKGNMIETFRGNKEYAEGDTVTYVDCQIHKPYCTVDSIYKVIFTRKHNKKTNCKI